MERRPKSAGTNKFPYDLAKLVVISCHKSFRQSSF
jgi:hypothetical protein